MIFKEEISDIQIENLFENTKAALVGIFVLTVITAIIFFIYFGDYKIFLWFSSIALISLIRYIDSKNYFKNRKKGVNYKQTIPNL